MRDLGKVPDSVLAKRSGRTIREIVAMRQERRIAVSLAGRRWTNRETQLLGTLSDRQVAQSIGREAKSVAQRRRQPGIAQHDGSTQRAWTQAEERQLGTMSDRDLARRLGRGLSAVANRRLNKRIPPFR